MRAGRQQGQRIGRIEQIRMMRFKDKKWDLFGPIISGEVGG